ncbi:hypothetical protein HID58_059068 [Brassica napus]|uniref:Telomere repeat-binding protein 1-6-like ubiquitin-like domain-containing protein n=1 Tax=Brassica napus TaxID=3708 RepID=A0ABQ7ZRU8_BRANA|nr:hypothetical protein HID58_059068 [Brassica napus]
MVNGVSSAAVGLHSKESRVMAAVTSLLSDGIHIGALVRGKKVRDENKSTTLYHRVVVRRLYLNGVLEVKRAIENWELKSPFTGSSSPVISGPKIQQTILT